VIVQLPDVDAALFVRMIKFIYTGKLGKLDDTRVADLLALSKRFGIEPLTVLLEGSKRNANNTDKQQCRLFPQAAFYKSMQYADVVFAIEVCKGVRTRIRAHRVVLSLWSEPFHAMFTNHMRESQLGEIELFDIKLPAFELLLEFCYRGAVDMVAKQSLALLFAADRFCIAPVVKQCSEFLGQHIDVANVCSMLSHVRLFKWTGLQHHCYRFLESNFQAVVERPEFVDMDRDSLMELIVSDQVLVPNEIAVYNAVLRWAYGTAQSTDSSSSATSTSPRQVAPTPSPSSSSSPSAHSSIATTCSSPPLVPSTTTTIVASTPPIASHSCSSRSQSTCISNPSSACIPPLPCALSTCSPSSAMVPSPTPSGSTADASVSPPPSTAALASPQAVMHWSTTTALALQQQLADYEMFVKPRKQIKVDLQVLMTFVRLPLLGEAFLRNVVAKNPFFAESDSYLNELLHEALKYHRKQDVVSSLPHGMHVVGSKIYEGIDVTNVRLRKRRGNSLVELAYCYPGDANGVCHYIGTNYGSSKWENPHNAKRLTVTMSSPTSRYTQPDVIVNRSFKSINYTTGRPAWCSLDLGAHHSLICNYYTLRGSGVDTDMRDWCLQARNDDHDWVVLREHVGDQLLASGDYGGWPVYGTLAQQAYRFFRIVVRGKGSLAICHWELYGYFK
jgi:hypothetical protein